VRRAARRHPLLITLLALALLFLCIRWLVAEPFVIQSGSMQPTLHPGDHVIVDKLAYRRGAPARGDLIVFRRPRTGEIMLKRLVAVGGDQVGIEDGVLHVNGRAWAEPFVNHRLVDSVYFGPVRVPRGSVFVMGDQRNDSVDSRAFGPVPTSRILGRADVRIWPPARIGGF
jgi:signal peptidase I